MFYHKLDANMIVEERKKGKTLKELSSYFGVCIPTLQKAVKEQLGVKL